MIDCFFGDAFGVLCSLLLEYCSAVWCSAAETHLIPLDRVVNVASFLTGGVFECDLAHRRSVAVLCIISIIKISSSAPSGKSKIVYKYLLQPHKHLCKEGH